MSRDELRRHLAERAVETRTFFVPMHLQPVFFRRYEGQRYPVAERLCGDGLYLPSASSLTPAEINFVCDCIRDAQRT
jgi:perosamine synthetase